MGHLILVPTPIGNMKDITLRSLDTLRDAAFILAEDGRLTSRLLKHYELGDKTILPYHKFNEHKKLQTFIEKIKQQTSFVALVSDAGTPGISDPGYLLVQECIKQGISVESLPGPTAIIPALINSGLPNDKFCFEGFLPHKKGRQTKLKELAEEKRTMVFYESPHRLSKTLHQLAEFMGEDRRASVSRELTKMYEETVRGTLHELKEQYSGQKVKGEIVIVVEGL
ncbi:MAG: 16S rRNA (cytidine(1402)-2'-O)-methyltransferase [Bacteroidota bacterium]